MRIASWLASWKGSNTRGGKREPQAKHLPGPGPATGGTPTHSPTTAPISPRAIRIPARQVQREPAEAAHLSNQLELADLDWNEAALIHRFRVGLSAQVKNMLLHHEYPKTLEEFALLAIKVDARIQEHLETQITWTRDHTQTTDHPPSPTAKPIPADPTATATSIGPHQPDDDGPGRYSSRTHHPSGTRPSVPRKTMLPMWKRDTFGPSAH
ncbi:hypothetical protein BASA83_002915 [Batrachochytrium salamandrivorans]|nr:hypothetical protein BASA83_002915 [Batrachochytrium salamandrivorans]